MVRDHDADRLSDKARERLHRYGIGVEEPATVEIHMDTRALGDREDARGGYSPQLDTIQLYEPLFESGAGPEEALVHEYVHKYRIDSRSGPPGEELHETVAEYERLEDEDDADRLRRYFEDPLAWEAGWRWGDVMQVIGPLSDRTSSMELAGVSIGPEEEAVAYYAGIAAAGRVGDTDYIEEEKDEILDPDRNYEEPRRQVEVLEELLEQHRSLREDGYGKDEAVRMVLSRIED